MINCIVFAGLLASGAALAAQESGIGLGMILGEPTGVSAKLWITDGSAFDAAAAWSFENVSAFHVHLDYLQHFFEVFNVPAGDLPVYLGLGARVKLETDVRIGMRVPVGLAYLFGSAPVDLFFEIVPILDIYPATVFIANAGLGIRYYLSAGPGKVVR